MKFGGFGTVVTVSKTIAAAGNYAANDVLSESASNGVGTTWSFTNVVKSHGDSAWICGLRMTCNEDSVVFRPRLHLFKDAIVTTELDDNEARVLDNDDRAAYIGYIDCPAFTDMGEFAFTQIDDIRKLVRCMNDERGVYGILEALDAETNETAGMIITIEMEVEWL